MLRKSHYTFLYLPDGHGQSRRVRVPRVAVYAAGGGALALIALAVCFLAGVGRKSEEVAPVPAGGADLQAELARLEEKVALLQTDLAASWRIQETVAATVGLDTLGSVVQAAGVGGREPLAGAPVGDLVVDDGRVETLDVTLDQLLRQARVQREGYQAILDTLQDREALRDALPTIRPVASGWVTSGYGTRADPFTGRPTLHEGLDFSVPLGTEVHATADGVVRDVVIERGFGHMVIVQHDGRTVTRYAHLSRPLVTRGQRVTRGEVIALSGRSGRATSPHLHYEVLVNGRPVNPLPYILDGYAWRR